MRSNSARPAGSATHPRGHGTALRACVACLAVGVVVLLGACSSSTSDAGGTTTSARHRSTTTTTTSVVPTTQAPTTTAVPVTTISAPPTTFGRGCSSPPGTVPAGAAATQIPDVDGDGRPDRAYFAPSAGNGTRQLVVITAAGGRASATVSSASPSAASALVVEPGSPAAPLVLLSDNREVFLFAYVNCTLAVVHNRQGAQYTFDLGFRGTGTGVGCIPDGARTDLVGLNIVSQDATTVHWSRTVIDVSGTSARNGASTTGTFTQPQDAAAISLLSTVSCGNQTISANGVHEPEG